MKRVVGLMVLVLCVCVVPVGSAVGSGSSGGGESDTVMLEDVIVTAGRVEERQSEVVSAVTVIDEEEIQKSSATDLGDLLAEKGIGHIHKYPGVSTSVGIRAFRTDTTGSDLAGHVLILIDGRRAGTGNVAKIMTKNIERIEIIRGPGSVQYGSAAMGGVVNVITREGKDRPTAFAGGMLGSFGYEEKSAGFSGKYGAFDFSGGFAADSMDDYDTASGARFYNTAYDHKKSGSLNLGYEILPENRLGLIYTYFNSEQAGNPGYLSQNDLDDYKDTANRSIDFIYNGKSRDGLFSWKARYFDGADVNNWFFPVGSNPDHWDDGISNKATVDFKGTQAQLSYNREYLLFTAGFDWVNYETESSKYSPKSTEYDNPAGFLLAKTRLFDERLILSGGVRYDTYKVEVKRGEGGTARDNYTSPSAGIAWRLTDSLKLRAGYGNAFRMPTAQQLACDMTMWAAHYVGNPDLSPEKSNTYEGGVDFSPAFLDASLTCFHTDYREKIESYTKANGDTSYRNLGKAEMEGIEGDFSCDMGLSFSWDYQVRPYVNFVYLATYKDKETDEDLKYTSDLHLSCGLALADSDDFSADLNLAYTGKQEITDYEGGTYAITTKGGFAVANLTVDKKIADAGKYGSVSLRGEIRNLFNKDYEYIQGYPMPGRSFFLGLRYDY